MVAEDNQSESTPLAPKSIHREQTASRNDSFGMPPLLSFSEYCKLVVKTEEIVKDLEARAAAMPFQPRDPKVWGVLTALSNKARKRKQGLNMVLKSNVHFIGRFVEDYPFRIDSTFVSREHCKIYKQTFASGDDPLKSQPLVFLKDNSSNGTYVNGERFTRRDDAVQIHHGDIISFIAPLHHDLAFMYREVLKPAASSNGVVTKRKAAEEVASETKRVKGIGVGAPESPQRSNTAMKNKKESITKSSLNQMKELHNQMKELQDMVDAKHKELVEASNLSAEQKHTRLAASLQSHNRRSK